MTFCGGGAGGHEEGGAGGQEGGGAGGQGEDSLVQLNKYE